MNRTLSDDKRPQQDAELQQFHNRISIGRVYSKPTLTWTSSPSLSCDVTCGVLAPQIWRDHLPGLPYRPPSGCGRSCRSSVGRRCGTSARGRMLFGGGAGWSGLPSGRRTQEGGRHEQDSGAYSRDRAGGGARGAARRARRPHGLASAACVAEIQCRTAHCEPADVPARDEAPWARAGSLILAEVSQGTAARPWYRTQW